MKEILVIDIETTGFLKQGGSIVEVGMVALDLDTGRKKIVYDSMMREKGIGPKTVARSWIVQNGYIAPDEILTAPPFDSQKAAMQQVLDRYALGATAYNRNFDFDFLESRGLRIRKKLPCPMLLSTPVCKLPKRSGGYKWPKVEEAWEHFFGPHTGYIEQHLGADDAFHEADIVYALYKQGHYRL